MGKIINYLFFYIGWAICLRQASADDPYIGPIVVAVILAIHLATVKNALAETLVIFSTALAGTLIDTIYICTGAIYFKAAYQNLAFVAPLWLSSLWALYGMSLNHSLVWLRGRKAIAAILGGSCAAVCYLGAEKAGAIEIYAPKYPLAAIIGIIWSFLFPLSLNYSQWALKKYSGRGRDGYSPFPS